MPKALPLEILYQIAKYLNCEDTGINLSSYALVCRQWQAIFEPLIYKNLHVHSSRFQTGNGIISLSHLRTLTSSSQHRIARRGLIRDLEYAVIVPYGLPDNTSSQIDEYTAGYTNDNVVRRANNAAFRDGMAELFKILHGWEGQGRLRVSLQILGRRRRQEPGTERCPNAIIWNMFNQSIVEPYRANFPEGRLNLPDVKCIHRLCIEEPCNGAYSQQIWLGAALSIARSCPMLHEFRWETFTCIRPYHLDFIRRQRRALEEGLAHLPPTLRIFDFNGHPSHQDHAELSAPSLIQNRIDFLPINLRPMTFFLEELTLVGISLPLDFLLPLNRHGKPSTASIGWPNLKKIVIDPTDFLPSGEGFFDLISEDELQATAGPSDLETEEPYNNPRHTPVRLKFDMCHRAYISLGYAAQHMPRLTSVVYQLPSEPFMNLLFYTDENTGGAGIIWDWSCDCLGYIPDSRVAEAWGFGIEDLEFLRKDPPGYPRVKIAQWPVMRT
ncbi:hypothetical protein BJX70DRAFT_395475 [Aspergillus crustosus]